MFDPEVLEHIRRHALACAPAEACGLVTAAGFEPVPNIATDPAEEFAMPAEVDQRIAAGEVLAVVHSHQAVFDQGRWLYDHPSVEDQVVQLAQGIPWGLCVVRGGEDADLPFFWGEGIPEQPLMPRDFRWGPTGTDGKGDCFAFLRDWYRQEMGLAIADVPRDRYWLEREGPNLYLEGVARHGFQVINEEHLRRGDAILCAMMSGGRPNHAAIYLGGGRIVHHKEHRLAEVEGFEAVRRSAHLYLRPPGAA